MSLVFNEANNDSGKVVSDVLCHSAPATEWSFRMVVTFLTLSPRLNIFSHILMSPVQIAIDSLSFSLLSWIRLLTLLVFQTTFYTTITNIDTVSSIRLFSKTDPKKIPQLFSLNLSMKKVSVL